MKLLNQSNLSNLTLTYNVAAGQYGLILIRYSGTAAVGVTVTTTQLGNIILNRKGSDKINVDVDLISQLDNLYGGVIEANSIAGGAFSFSSIVPIAAWFDANNILDVSNDDKLYFKLDFPQLLPAVIQSGVVAIYAKPRAGVQTYYHKILSRQIVSAGIGTITDVILESNIIETYIKNPIALIDQIQLLKDNKVLVDGDTASELAYSNWIHLVETSTTMLAIEFAESQNILESTSNNLGYKFHFTSAGNLLFYYSAIEYAPDKQSESIINAKNNVI